MSNDRGTVVVGFHSIGESAGALKWAIEQCREHERTLVVVHASAVAIAVDNGPSAAIAHRLGNPTWATVHSVVTGFNAPAGTTTKVRSGEAAGLIASEAHDASLVVLGPRRRRLLRRHDTQRELQSLLDCPVVRIDNDSATPDRRQAEFVGTAIDVSDSVAA